MKYQCEGCGRIWPKQFIAERCCPHYVFEYEDDEVIPCRYSGEFCTNRECRDCEGSGWVKKQFADNHPIEEPS